MGKSKLFIFRLLSVFLLYSCQSVNLAGHYGEAESYGSKHDLNLFKDSSFQYIIKEGLACDTILGDWTVLENKKIILTPNKIVDYHNEAKCDTCEGKFYIKTYSLSDKYELINPFVRVYDKGMIIEDGIIHLVEDAIIQKADSIMINFYGFEPHTFAPQNKHDVIVNVFLIEDHQKVLQIDRILKIKKDKLVSETGKVVKKIR